MKHPSHKPSSHDVETVTIGARSFDSLWAEIEKPIVTAEMLRAAGRRDARDMASKWKSTYSVAQKRLEQFRSTGDLECETAISGKSRCRFYRPKAK